MRSHPGAWAHHSEEKGVGRGTAWPSSFALQPLPAPGCISPFHSQNVLYRWYHYLCSELSSQRVCFSRTWWASPPPTLKVVCPVCQAPDCCRDGAPRRVPCGQLWSMGHWWSQAELWCPWDQGGPAACGQNVFPAGPRTAVGCSPGDVCDLERSSRFLGVSLGDPAVCCYGGFHSKELKYFKKRGRAGREVFCPGWSLQKSQGEDWTNGTGLWSPQDTHGGGQHAHVTNPLLGRT